LILVTIFFYNIFNKYLSDDNKKKIYKNRTEDNRSLNEKILNLPVLKNDTLNVIHFNYENKQKKKTNRKFWDLIK
jgi:hypothetical protein